MDDISLLFASDDWKSYKPEAVEEDITEQIAKGLIPIPVCEEVERIEVRRRNEQEALVLIQSKQKHKEKMDNLKEKMAELQKEQQDLVDNLTKFNTFVKEKKLKVERAIKTEKEERELREKMTLDIENKDLMVIELTIAKEYMANSVQKRKLFGDFLKTVVDCEEARNR